MTQDHFEIAIIGAGPGGYVAANRAAQAGMSVALVEQAAQAGGVCLHRGCIPTKLLLSAADAITRIKHSEGMGIAVTGLEFDWPTLQTTKRRTIDALAKGIEHLLKSRRVSRFLGRGMLIDGHTVAVDVGDEQARISADAVVVATGSRPIVPSVWRDLERVITSRELLEMPSLPESITVVGGGVVGCEFASCLSRLGCQVYLVEKEPSLLPMFPAAHAGVLAGRLCDRDSVQIHVGTTVESIEEEDSSCRIRLQDGNEWQTQWVLLALGREPNTAELGLENANIETNAAGAVVVDENGRTSCESVFCIGDANARCMLAHVAMEQGKRVVQCLRGAVLPALPPVPWCVYTDPELASLGLSKDVAEEQGRKVRTATFPFSANGKSHVLGDTIGQIDVVQDETSNEILGVHMVGHNVTELIHVVTGFLGKSSVEELDSVIFAHPTQAESIEEALLALYQRSPHLPWRRPPMVTGQIL